MEPPIALLSYRDYESPRAIEADILLSNLAHHWRQPLNYLSLGLQNIKEMHEEGELDGTSLETAISSLHETLVQLSGTIDLFRYAFRSGKEQGTFDAINVVKNAIDILYPALEAAHISCLASLPVSDFSLSGDPQQLLRVLLSLLTNAKEAHQTSLAEERHVIVEVYPENRSIVIADHGCGIPVENLPKIFDPYFTTKFKAAGTGMGLYMAQRIMKEHFNGVITIDSHPGGTRVTLAFPQKDLP